MGETPICDFNKRPRKTSQYQYPGEETWGLACYDPLNSLYLEDFE